MLSTISGTIIQSDSPKWEDLTTTENEFEEVPVHWPNDDSQVKEHWPCAGLGAKSLMFKADTNDLIVSLQYSLDRGETFIVEEEFTVEDGETIVKEIPRYCHALKVKAKPAVDDTHGTLSVSGGGAAMPAPAMNQVLAYLGSDVSEGTGAAEDLVIPAGTKRIVVWAGTDGEGGFEKNDDATAGSETINYGNSPITIDDYKGSITQLSVWPTAGKIGADFFG